jgi:ribosomal protein S18 acetylase RimI-like enzyme
VRVDIAAVVEQACDSPKVRVALIEDRLVGVIAYEDTASEDGPVSGLYIVVLAVHVDYRRQLIGTGLKQHVIEVARASGLVDVSSHVHRRNHRMKSLNERLGVSTTPDPDDGELVLSVAKA